MQYAALISMARNDSDQGRAALIEQLANLYLDKPEEPNDVEAELFADITSTVLKDVAADICNRIAGRLAKSPRLPHRLAMDMARSDRREMYHPILSESPVLTDGDLAGLVGELSEQQCLAVVERPHLSEIVTDALVDTQHQSVQREVSAHKGAVFSQAGLEKLLEATVEDTVLRDNLVSRTWEELEQNSTQFFDRLKRAFQTVLGDNQSLAQIDLEFAPRRIADYTNQLFVEFADQRGTERDAIILADKIQSGEADPDQVFVQLVDGQNHKVIVALMAKMLAVPEHAVRKAYSSADSVVFSLLCHHLNLMLNSYKALTELRIFQLKSAAMDYHRLVDRYRTITRRDSQRMVRIIRMTAESGQSGQG